MFIGRTDEAETPVLWPPDAKSWLIWKDPDAGEDWRQEEKGMTEDEMIGWHHWLNEHGFGWTLGVGDGQGGLACCDSWGRKELDTSERLNWTSRLLCCCCYCCLVSKLCPTVCTPMGCSPARLFCPWDFLGKQTGVVCHFLLQGIFLTQGLNACLLHWQADSLFLNHWESPFCEFLVI